MENIEDEVDVDSTDDEYEFELYICVVCSSFTTDSFHRCGICGVRYCSEGCLKADSHHNDICDRNHWVRYKNIMKLADSTCNNDEKVGCSIEGCEKRGGSLYEKKDGCAPSERNQTVGEFVCGMENAPCIGGIKYHIAPYLGDGSTICGYCRTVVRLVDFPTVSRAIFSDKVSMVLCSACDDITYCKHGHMPEYMCDERKTFVAGGRLCLVKYVVKQMVSNVVNSVNGFSCSADDNVSTYEVSGGLSADIYSVILRYVVLLTECVPCKVIPVDNGSLGKLLTYVDASREVNQST